MEHKRQMDLVHLLLNQDDYITIHQLSRQLNVSDKTIRNDLSAIADWLTSNGLTLIKKTGMGIRVEGGRAQVLSALNLLNSHREKAAAYSPEARKLYIALRLITCEDSCRIYELAKELFVSRATIHKDISSLNGLLSQYHIQLIRKNNNGVQLAGKERSLRDIMLHFMEQDDGCRTFTEIVQNPGYVCQDAFIFAALDYTDRDICHFTRLLMDSGNDFLLSLSFPALLTTLLRLFICLIRMLDGHFVSLSSQFMLELEQKAFFPEAAAVGELLSREYGLTLPPSELRYMQVHFLSLRSHDDAMIQTSADALPIAAKLLSDWEQIFGYPFSSDPDLLASLSAHLEPAITRLKHGIPVENPMMYEIQHYYKNTFSVVKKSVGFIEELYHCRLSDDEVGYLAIYLATALEHTKQPLSTILVSHGGSGAGKLLLDKLSNQIPEIRITSLESFISVQKADLSGTDLILSTLNLPLDTQIPIIRITPLLSSLDILHLKEEIVSYYNAKNDPLSIKKRE